MSIQCTVTCSMKLLLLPHPELWKRENAFAKDSFPYTVHYSLRWVLGRFFKPKNVQELMYYFSVKKGLFVKIKWSFTRL